MNIAQINLLSSFYGVNFDYFNNHQKSVGKRLLSYALDFTDMSPLDLWIDPENKISFEIIKEFKHKIYPKKFMFLDLIQNLTILLRFKYFEFPLMFDCCGRAYLDTAMFNYLHSIIKSFISGELRLLLKKELYPKVKALVQKQFDAVSKGKIILSEPKKSQSWISLCQQDWDKNLFEVTNLYMDLHYLTYDQKNYTYNVIIVLMLHQVV